MVNRASGERAQLRASPKVSVLLCVYNERPEHLVAAVESILRQTLEDWELVLVDDGSDEAEIVRVLEELSARDARIRLWRTDHVGLTASLNRGLEHCRGEYVARHDSDDWSDAGRFEAQVRELDSRPELALVGSNALLHRDDGHALWPTVLPLLDEEIRRGFPTANPFCHGALMFRRHIADRVGGYEGRLTSSQDYDFCWRVSEAGEVCNLEEPLYHLRLTEGSCRVLRSREQILASIVIRELARQRDGGDLPLQRDAFDSAAMLAGEELDERMLERLSRLYGGDRSLLAGYGLEALRQYLGALRHWPLEPLGWLKLARWGLYQAVPPLRRHLFRPNAARSVDASTEAVLARRAP